MPEGGISSDEPRITDHTSIKFQQTAQTINIKVGQINPLVGQSLPVEVEVRSKAGIAMPAEAIKWSTTGLIATRQTPSKTDKHGKAIAHFSSNTAGTLVVTVEVTNQDTNTPVRKSTPTIEFQEFDLVFSHP